MNNKQIERLWRLAASTGALRVYNNKHWIGDVAFGAGLANGFRFTSLRLLYGLPPVSGTAPTGISSPGVSATSW